MWSASMFVTTAITGSRFKNQASDSSASSMVVSPRPHAPQAGPPAANDQAAASTIDALFAPLPRTETVGRAWLYVEKTLRPLRLRLGITDGQTTELLEGDLTEGQELVTNVTIAGQTTRPAARAPKRAPSTHSAHPPT